MPCLKGVLKSTLPADKCVYVVFVCVCIKGVEVVRRHSVC